MNIEIHGMCICIIIFFLLFLGLKMTTSFFLSLVLRFNKSV